MTSCPASSHDPAASTSPLAGRTTDVVDFETNGNLEVTREQYGGKVETTYAIDHDTYALTVRPGDERRTSLDVDVGTAGSVTLLFDAVLPIAVTGDEPLELTATGRTGSGARLLRVPAACAR